MYNRRKLVNNFKGRNLAVLGGLLVPDGLNLKCILKKYSFFVGTGPTAVIIYSLVRVMNVSQNVICRNEPFSFRCFIVATTEHILRLEIFLSGMYYYAIFIKNDGTKIPAIMTRFGNWIF